MITQLTKNKIILFVVCTALDIPAVSEKNRLIFVCEDSPISTDYLVCNSTVVPQKTNIYKYLDYNGARYNLNLLLSSRLKDYIANNDTLLVGLKEVMGYSEQ